jgi:hypothetical protein
MQNIPHGGTMTTESSAVSDLIRLTRTRRMRTDPADLFIFKPSAGAAPRMLEPHPGWVPPAPVVAAAPARVVRPQAPVTRRRAWPIVVSMLLAGGLGIGAAAYFAPASSARVAVDLSSFVPTPPPPVVAPPVAAAPVAAPVPAPAIAPTIPTVEAPVVAPVEPAAPVQKHVVKKKVVAKKHVKAKAPVRHADEDDAPTPPPVKTAPVVKRSMSQAADKENPL